MIPKPPHNRKLGLCGVSLTQARLNKENDNAFKCVQNTIEKVIVRSRYFENAPFSWVTIAIRFGLKNDEKPVYQRINKKYGDLPLSIEVDTHELIDASLNELKTIYSIAVLKSLIHAGKKYQRPIKKLEEMFQNINSIC